MKFHTYLKSCRERFNLTQEQLIQELYNTYDTFEGLDVSTFSRWERDISVPGLDRQVKIIQLFHEKSNTVFPCFDNRSSEEVENDICNRGIKNLIGHSNQHILKFPSVSFQAGDIKISHIRSTNDIDRAITMPHAVMQGFTNNNPGMTTELLKSWALHSSNLFLVSEVHGQFFGLFFNLRLKPKVFEKIMNFEMGIFTIGNDDFAAFSEMGCNLPLLFFANNEEVASLLFLRYYAHLIANQDNILEIGTTPIRDGGKKMAVKMKLKHYKDIEMKQGTRSAYRASLADVLINETVLKMMFQRQDA